MKLNNREHHIIQATIRLYEINKANKANYGTNFIPDYNLIDNCLEVDEMIQIRNIIQEEVGD